MRLLAAIILLAACGDDDAALDASSDARMQDSETPGDAADDGEVPTDGDVDGAEEDGGECSGVWAVDLAESAGAPMARVDEGALILDVDRMPPGEVAVEVSQGDLVGDFDAAFAFEGFVAGDVGAYVQAFVEEGDDRAIARVETDPTEGIRAAFTSGDADDAETTSWMGTMRFVRVGDELTVTVTTDDASVSASKSMTGPLRVGVQVGNTSDTTVLAATTVRFSRFELTGGGASVLADEFTCDTLRD